MLIVIRILFTLTFSQNCPIVEGNSCSGYSRDICESNETCVYIPANGCCSDDFCVGIVENLASRFGGLDFVKQMICETYIKYCEWKSASKKCVLSKCYQRESTDCSSDGCHAGNCPIGKLFPDGSTCCNPSGVNPPDCFNNGANTWENCSNTDGCSFYGGNCYPDICENIPESIPLLPVSIEDQVKGYCYLDNHHFRQDPCYAIPAGFCYDNNSNCYYEDTDCPFNFLSGGGTGGCCASDDIGEDTTACASKKSKSACVNLTTAECVWNSGKRKCLVNPCKTNVLTNCRESDGCKWGEFGGVNQCYPSTFDGSTTDDSSTAMHLHILSKLGSFLVLVVSIVDRKSVV